MKITNRNRGYIASQEMAVIMIRVLIVMPIVVLAIFWAIVFVAVYEIIATVAELVRAKQIRRGSLGNLSEWSSIWRSAPATIPNLRRRRKVDIVSQGAEYEGEV